MSGPVTSSAPHVPTRAPNDFVVTIDPQRQDSGAANAHVARTRTRGG